MSAAAPPGRPRGPVTGAILAGGMATRYGGRPKGLERVGGERIVDRAADALRAVADELLLVANDPRGADWLPGVRTVPDVHPGLGGLGGIHAALAHAPGGVLVLAWDMPFVPPPLLAELLSLGTDGAHDAAVPASGSRRGVEPLCAYYGPPCLAAVERRLAAGDRRVVAFHEDVRVARLDAAAVARHGDPARIFLNVNTPDDLALAEAHLAEAHAPTTDGGRDRPQA